MNRAARAPVCPVPPVNLGKVSRGHWGWRQLKFWWLSKAGGSEIWTLSDIIMMAWMVNIMEQSYFSDGSTGREVMAGNDWHLAGCTWLPLQSVTFGGWKNWVGFTSPSLFSPARRSYKQYNKFVTVAAQLLSAEGMYRTRRCSKTFSEMTICLLSHWKHHSWPQLMRSMPVLPSSSFICLYYILT